MAFVAVASVAQLSSLALGGTRSIPAALGSCGLLAGVITLAVVWKRLAGPQWASLLMAWAYIGSLALLCSASDGGWNGLQPLVVFPIVWVALCHRPYHSAVMALAAVSSLALTSEPAHVGTEQALGGTAAWGLAGLSVVLVVSNLRGWLGAALQGREEAIRQAEILDEVARELNSTLDPDRVITIGVRLAAEIASPLGSRPPRANYCRVFDGLVHVDTESDAEGEWRGQRWPLSEHPHLARVVQTRVPTTGALGPAVLGPTVREINRSQGVGHGGWVPVVVEGELHGVLAVAGRNRPVSEQELSRCVAIVRIMQLALRNALAHQRLERAALTDPLTSVANRRGLERLVTERRRRGMLAVLAVDLDGLKEVNDRRGHAAGDRLLVLAAQMLTSSIRTGDLVARVGGDEFVCVLFDADEEGGAHAAKRVLKAVLDARAPDELGVSVGIAVIGPGTSLGDGIRRADMALYEAKRAGGMRYVVASAEPCPSLSRGNDTA